ncbi:hypothetical protein GQX73_g3238 [Xylaria multiplex]|uniref:Uncharacterized protein n=1 Tax=Xylaria multiplex TaxID=323545 RepID=A0A7C8MWS5_9PEZI|nr:hypothetical protein GQX73_g3238 [Xylaria multiplex]
MKFIIPCVEMGIVGILLLTSTAVLGNPRLASPDISQAGDAMVFSRILEKRDAYTCYGSNAIATDCQAALDQLRPLEDQNFEVYSGICLNWSQDTCNVRFCAQPYVAKTVNRTASWIYRWAGSALMGCIQGGQYAVMGDSLNLNGNGGTYRLHVEQATPRHG